MSNADDENIKIAKANSVQESLESAAPTRQNMIDLQYANADEKRAIESRTKLYGRLEGLFKELNGDEETADESDVDRQIEEVQREEKHECTTSEHADAVTEKDTSSASNVFSNLNVADSSQ